MTGGHTKTFVATDLPRLTAQSPPYLFARRFTTTHETDVALTASLATSRHEGHRRLREWLAALSAHGSDMGDTTREEHEKTFLRMRDAFILGNTNGTVGP